MRVPRGRENQHAAITEQVVIAIEFEVVELACIVQIGHDECARRGTALEFLGPPALVKLFLLQHVNRVREHFNVADVIQVGMRGHDDLDLVSRIAKLLQLHVDDVSPLLAGFQEVAIARCPILFAIVRAVGNRDVVARVEYNQALGVIEHPHADGDGDLTGLVCGQSGDQAADIERTEKTAGSPIQFLREHAGRRCNAQQAEQCSDDASFLHGFNSSLEF